MDSTSTGTVPHFLYPEPTRIPPISGSHKQTFILLHGGGMTGEEFAAALLEEPIPDFGNLQSAFPDAKFIFPTATEQYAAGLGVLNRQFFHLSSTTDLDDKDYVQFSGLRDSVTYIHTILQSAIDDVGPRNVVLGGFSQGCAVTLFSLLLCGGSPFAAAIGLAGWLPLRRRIEDCWAAKAFGDEFARFRDAVACLRETIDVPSTALGEESVAAQIPVYLGHGLEDKALPLFLARPTHDLLLSMNLDVTLRDYDGLGHWFSGHMLRDVISFLQESTQFRSSTTSST